MRIGDPEKFLIDSYYHNLDINYFFSSQHVEPLQQKIFVCPVDALTIKDNRIYKNDSCIRCGLCDLKYCQNVNNKYFSKTPMISDYFLTDIQRLSVALKYLSNNQVLFACEVKAEGNFRKKRIDIVFRKGKEVFLVKALSNLGRRSYYRRAYVNICHSLEKKFPEFSIKIKTLIPSENFSLDKAKCESICTVNNVLLSGGS